MSLKYKWNIEKSYKIGDRSKALILIKNVLSSGFSLQEGLELFEIAKNERDFDAAIAIFHAAIQAGQQNEILFESIVDLAINSQVYDTALKLLLILQQLYPDNKRNYTNSALCLQKLGKAEEAVEILQCRLSADPTYAPYWNMLGTLAFESLNNWRAATEFYREAYRLSPDDFQIVNNLANILAKTEEAEQLYRDAINIKPEATQPNVGLALKLFGQGRLVEAYPHYEKRLNDSPVVYEDLGSRLWKGQLLAEKTILVLAEQGVGDELFFGMLFHYLIDSAKKVIISCDIRLKSMFTNAFPKALVISYDDSIKSFKKYRYLQNGNTAFTKPDFHIYAASLMKFFWKTIDDPKGRAPYLKADQKLIEKWKGYFSDFSVRPKIGISWRSGMAGGERDLGQVPLEQIYNVALVTQADFFILQYSFEEEEVDTLLSLPNVHKLECIDLKQDLDDTLAIMSFMDMVIGPATTTQIMAACLGRRVLLASWGAPWWAFGQPSKAPFAIAKDLTFHNTATQEWTGLVKEYVSKYNYFFALNDCQERTKIMASQRIIRHPEYSRPTNSYSLMQRKAMDEFAQPWNPQKSLEDLGYGIGNFDDHDNWSLYDKYFFEGMNNCEELTLLDFACGAGRNIANWWYRFKHIDGVDISINMLTNAVSYLNYKEIPAVGADRDVNLFLSNGENLKVIKDDNTYDIITSTIAMQHICVHEVRFSLLKEFYRLLKPGGCIAIQMAYGEDHPKSVRYFENHNEAIETNRGCDVRVETPDEIHKDLLEIGFEDFIYHIDKAPPGSDLRRGGRAIYFKAYKHK